MKGWRLTVYGWYLILLAFVVLSVLCLCGCRSASTVERDTEEHRVSQLIDRMDSLVCHTATWQRDIYARQSSLVDSIRQMERNDSSHVVTVNERGDTVRERIEVHHYTEREHSSESRESETIVHLQDKVDSLLHIVRESNAMTDSLLKEHSKETVVVKKPSLWERVKSSVGGYAIVLVFSLFILLIIYVRRKRPPM